MKEEERKYKAERKRRIKRKNAAGRTEHTPAKPLETSSSWSANTQLFFKSFNTAHQQFVVPSGSAGGRAGSAKQRFHGFFQTTLIYRLLVRPPSLFCLFCFASRLFIVASLFSFPPTAFAHFLSFFIIFFSFLSCIFFHFCFTLFFVVVS